MAKYGLIGHNIEHSFSRKFFSEKFEKEKRKDTYVNFDIDSIEKLPEIIRRNPELRGLNVTIPYKTEVIPYLDRIDKEAEEINAVNTIKLQSDGTLIGYNTDHYGFAQSLLDVLPLKNRTAMILGSGGASKAIAYVLKTMQFEYIIVSRNKRTGDLMYQELTKKIMDEHCLIINCTPLGTFPNVEKCPSIPYQHINSDHVLFDLIYNPSETEFMKRGFIQGAKVYNGLKMLEFQAKKSWSIWKS